MLFYITSRNRTCWSENQQVQDQPNGIDYEYLQGKINKSMINEIADNSKIPVPGLLIPYENDENEYAPPTSDLQGPSGEVWL